MPEDMPETVLDFCSESRRLSVAGDRADVDRRVCESRIIEFLTDTPEPQTQAQIRDAVEGQTKIIRAALTALVEAAKVKKSGDGTRGKPFLYEFPNSGSHYTAGTSKPESEKVVEPRMETGEILVPENSDNSILVPESGEQETAKPTYHCWTHPKNKTEWWLRGGIDPVCGLCHPNPAAT